MGGIVSIDKGFNSFTGLDMGLDIRSEKYDAYFHKKYGELTNLNHMVEERTARYLSPSLQICHPGKLWRK